MKAVMLMLTTFPLMAGECHSKSMIFSEQNIGPSNTYWTKYTSFRAASLLFSIASSSSSLTLLALHFPIISYYLPLR